MLMSKNSNNDISMNPPVLDRGYQILFCADPMKSYPGIVWTATVHDLNRSFTHNKHRLGALNTNLHFRLSRLPVVASTYFFPLRFEYLFTLRRREIETYPIYEIYFKIGAVQHCSGTKLEPKSPLLCVIMCFFVSTQELSGIVRT